MINLHLSKERDLTSEFINPNWHQSKIKGNKNSLIINSTYNISFSNQNGRQDIQIQFSSVQFFSRVRLFVTQWTAARQASTSPTRRVYSNSCPLSRWWHPTISCSVVPFSSHLQSFPASGSFPMNQLFASGGQSIGVSASTSVLLMNIQDWFPLGWTGWISLQSKGLSRVFSNTTVQKRQFFGSQLSL